MIFLNLPTTGKSLHSVLPSKLIVQGIRNITYHMLTTGELAFDHVSDHITGIDSGISEACVA